MTIGIVTDSNAQLPQALRARYDIRVVPLGITIDGDSYEEGVDLSNDEFYRRLGEGAVVTTSAPSPGSVLAQYEILAATGCENILSIHIGSNTSATLNSVKIAAELSPIPVEIVDTGTASFAIGCCVWAAAEALIAGASLAQARDRALKIAASIGNVFVVGATDLAAAGGRLAADARCTPSPVLALEGGQMRAVAQVFNGQSAADAMVDYVVRQAGRNTQRIGVGSAGVEFLAEQLVTALQRTYVATEIVRYDIGPSVGAHTGFGTYGCVFFPS